MSISTEKAPVPHRPRHSQGTFHPRLGHSAPKSRLFVNTALYWVFIKRLPGNLSHRGGIQPQQCQSHSNLSRHPNVIRTTSSLPPHRAGRNSLNKWKRPWNNIRWMEQGNPGWTDLYGGIRSWTGFPPPRECPRDFAGMTMGGSQE